jgi:hypothetical protein
MTLTNENENFATTELVSAPSLKGKDVKKKQTVQEWFRPVSRLLNGRFL